MNKEKPLILKIEEAKIELTQCVNNILSEHGLNCYLIEPVFAELYAQIKSTARSELEHAQLYYVDAEDSTN